MRPPEQLPSKVSPEMVDVFACSRRRHVLAALNEADAPLALADLAREVVALEREAPKSELGHEHVRKCHVSLYHNHVPKLADAGAVTFDVDRRTVALDRSSLPVELESY